MKWAKFMGGVKLFALQNVYKGQQIRKEFGIPLDAKVVLSVGEVNKNKNHKVGIEALAKLKNSDIYYVICGRGPLLSKLKKLAKDLNVGNQVVFAGYRTDVADFYKMANLFLFPSFREGLPVAVMEAMASGLPIIATYIRGSSDIIKENINGALLNPDDVESFANTITMFQNAELQRKMSDINAKEAIKYDLDTVMKLYQQAYFGMGE